MYLMVDVVVNNVMATSLTPDYSTYMFKDQKYYHPYCPIDWSNITSEQQCSLGDTVVPLPDVNTENPTVISQYSQWISELVQTYSIDGLRIDAAKHVSKTFWPHFALRALGYSAWARSLIRSNVAECQGSDALDSVLNYPCACRSFWASWPTEYDWAGRRPRPVEATIHGYYSVVPRWHNLSVDPQSLYNAMTFNFLSDGIPIVYHGQEQGFSGSADPYNREPLWPSNYTNTSSYQLISTLNQLRNFLVNTTDWATQDTQVLTHDNNGLAFKKGDVVTVLTSIGAPPQNFTHTAFQSPWSQGTVTIDVIACRQFVVASSGYLEVEYTKGGVPVVLAPSSFLKDSGLCCTAMAALQRPRSDGCAAFCCNPRPL
ncbi:glycoside hydrolase superfamily [Mycena sp. CBHHK59/15]|nr:glycoside hydrolase superfamily [Mycena sp. CBHHK59/15]